MSHVEEITEKLIQMMAAESEWVKTGIELEEVHNGIRRVAEGVAPHVVRLLANEREKVREQLCCGVCRWCTLKVHKHIIVEPAIFTRGEWLHHCKTGLRQWTETCLASQIRCVPLDLTKDLAPSSTEEGERSRFTMEIDLDEKGGDAK